jgi:hypothetical protein
MVGYVYVVVVVVVVVGGGGGGGGGGGSGCFMLSLFYFLMFVVMAGGGVCGLRVGMMSLEVGAGVRRWLIVSCQETGWFDDMTGRTFIPHTLYTCTHKTHKTHNFTRARTLGRLGPLGPDFHIGGKIVQVHFFGCQSVEQEARGARLFRWGDVCVVWCQCWGGSVLRCVGVCMGVIGVCV